MAEISCSTNICLQLCEYFPVCHLLSVCWFIKPSTICYSVSRGALYALIRHGLQVAISKSKNATHRGGRFTSQNAYRTFQKSWYLVGTWQVSLFKLFFKVKSELNFMPSNTLSPGCSWNNRPLALTSRDCYFSNAPSLEHYSTHKFPLKYCLTVLLSFLFFAFFQF
jgi:hypothetical protein